MALDEKQVFIGSFNFDLMLGVPEYRNWGAIK
jgi:hypothetical protein